MARLIPLALALAAAAGLSPLLGAPAPKAALHCPAPPGWSDVLRQAPRFVVVGELHGTEQPPQLVGELVCAEALKGKRVLLAVELDSRLDERLQAAWNLPSGQFEPAVAKLGWEGRQDGLASKAMFDLLVRMHLLKERGLPVAITTFNGAKSKEQFEKFARLPGQGGHEATQAENIAAAATAGAPDLVIVLVGNFHARKAPIERRGVAWDPMARYLSGHGKVVSLDMRYGPGTSWNCLMKPDVKLAPGQRIGPEHLNCGPSPTPGNTKAIGPVRIELPTKDPAAAAEGFDGTYWVGPVTASPPAFR